MAQSGRGPPQRRARAPTPTPCCLVREPRTRWRRARKRRTRARVSGVCGARPRAWLVCRTRAGGNAVPSASSMLKYSLNAHMPMRAAARSARKAMGMPARFRGVARSTSQPPMIAETVPAAGKTCGFGRDRQRRRIDPPAGDTSVRWALPQKAHVAVSACPVPLRRTTLPSHRP